MHKTEFVLENKKPEILYEFELETDPLILERRSINKKRRTYHQEDSAVSVDHGSKMKDKR